MVDKKGVARARALRKVEEAPGPEAVSLQQYEDFIRSAVDWVWEVDSNLNYVFVSKGIARVIGVPAQVLSGTYVFSLSYFKHVDEVLLSTVEAIDDRMAFRNRAVSLEDAGGARRALLLSGVPVFDPESGEFKGYRGTGTELTGGAGGEEELIPLQQAVQDYAELSSTWRWQADSRLRVSELSEDYEPKAGLGRAESLDRSFVELWQLGEPARALIAERRAFRAQRASWTHSGRAEEQSFLISGRPVLDDGGRLAGYRGIGSDASAQIDSDEDALMARQMAENANRAKSEFLANTSHELRTPLNAIIGFSDAMRTEMLGAMGNEQYREYADDIHTSAHHILDIIDQILDLSRIEAGKVELSEERIELAELIENCGRMLRTTIEMAGLALEIEKESDIPPLWADPAKLKQILLNLLGNALKFTPSGGRIQVMSRINAAGHLEIEVRDTGVGIKSGDIPKVPARFGQSGQGGQAGKGGVGLGLSITKSLVELHGGVLKIVSREGAGTRALVQLPKERLMDEGDESEPWKILF